MIFRKTLLGGLLATLILTSIEIGEGRLNRTSAQLDVTPGRSHIPMIHVRHGRGSATSTNWSGYAVTGANGSVSDVKASWLVPMVSCDPKNPTNQYASFWVGIDGYSSNTVEQIGTDSDCVKGQPVYYVWYEMYPHWSYTVNSVAIGPGNVISAEVSANAKGTFTLTLTNQTSKGTFTISAKMPSADRSSAELIAEAPWSGGVLPLANFGSAQFGSYYTRIAGTSSATVNGTKAGIASSNSIAITMIDKNGFTKAQPNLTDDSSFSIDWQRAGP
jgi:Peptidase A4 family